ncbi:hypothetical protein L596_003955 [Steinernema carpocapsae]|nr:hypothetical protein L596_003955 [Steinernema carpocapsae]
MYHGSKCPQYCMVFYSLAFWCTGLGLLFLGVWMLAEPRRSYVLDLVDFSEDDPLLRFACYIAIFAGILTLFVGFLACCGAVKGARCLLTGFVAFVILIFFAELTVGVFAVYYRGKFRDDRMATYLTNFSANRYHRDRWVTPLMDTIQFYRVTRVPRFADSQRGFQDPLPEFDEAQLWGEFGVREEQDNHRRYRQNAVFRRVLRNGAATGPTATGGSRSRFSPLTRPLIFSSPTTLSLIRGSASVSNLDNVVTPTEKTHQTSIFLINLRLSHIKA